MVVRPARTAAELRAALRLRERVFCEEQGVPVRAERDGRDAEAIHLLALEDGNLLGTCRLLVEGEVARLGRLAVTAGARRRGIATAILAAADAEARRAGAARVALHAQVDAERLYALAGYLPRGERFVEEGIDHVAMVKDLA